MILRARHVLAADGQAIENGAVRAEGGRIVEVGPAGSIEGSPTDDLGNSLLLPGLINAHTHLELTHLAGRVPPRGDFVDWINRLVQAMRADGEDPDTVRAAVRKGRDLSLQAGVTTVGDIARLSRLTRPILASGPLRVLSFGEVIAIGKLRSRLAERLEAAADTSARGEFLEVGVSPHAPYTVEPQGLAACVDWAVACGLRLCMHLAETAEEALFTTNLAGPVRDYLEQHGAMDRHVPCPGLPPVEYVASAGLLGPDTLLAHANYVNDQDIRRIAASGAHVVYCPRTHAAFNHPPHPFERMLACGVNVCVGTDSLASNPSLSVLEELRFLRSKHPDLPASLLIEMGTIRAARALGMEGTVGSVLPGTFADLTVIPLDPTGPSDPLENILASTSSPGRTYVAGSSVTSASQSG
ncbi:MAG: amidohydrolase family protein [Planctomycetota bacterium]|jgi:cytosine/adenosine deaminase-related metal-dependent hydrolase